VGSRWRSGRPCLGPGRDVRRYGRGLTAVGGGGEDTGGGCHGPVLEQEEGALCEIRRGWAQGRGGVTSIVAGRPGAAGRPAGRSSRVGRGVKVKGVGPGWGRCGRGYGTGVDARSRQRSCRTRSRVAWLARVVWSGASVSSSRGVEGQSAGEQGSAAPQLWGRPVDFRAGRGPGRGRLAKAWGNATAAPGCDGAASRGVRTGIVGAKGQVRSQVV